MGIFIAYECTTNLENSLTFYWKTVHILQPSNFTPRHILQRNLANMY